MTHELGGPQRLKRAASLALLVALGVSACLAPADSVAMATANLAWTPSTDPTVIGYHLYYGVASGVYTNFLDIGELSSGTISNLASGVTYYFAATAYNIVGLESDFSNEVSYSVPLSPLVATANNQTCVYGATHGVLTGSLSGLQAGDDITATYTTTATATSPVGTYAIVPVLNDPDGELPNYTVTLVNGTLTILPDATTGALTSSANPSMPGQPVTFELALNAVPPGTGTPTGTMQLLIDGTLVGGPVPLTDGVASYTTSSLAHGSHTVAAQYAGDGNFTGTTNFLASAQVINTPPTAGPYTLTDAAGSTAKIPISTLLANGSDADGDSLAFVGVSATSAHGGTVVTNSGWVLYTPPAGFTNTDTFTYQITDNRSAPVTGVVTVAISVDDGASRNLTIANVGGGSFLIHGSGVSGCTYAIQFTANLPPTANWNPLGTAVADANGSFVFIDTGVSGSRFYRAVYP